MKRLVRAARAGARRDFAHRDSAGVAHCSPCRRNSARARLLSGSASSPMRWLRPV